MADFSSLLQKSKDSASSDLISDALHEILLRLDPTSIFNCILVSKGWLRLIAGPVFRQNYLDTWKDDPNLLLGFLRYESLHSRVRKYHDDHQSRPLRLLQTSKLGRIINESKSLQGIGDFISKSPNKPLMLFADMHHRTFYVANPFSGDHQPLQLPQPPAYYNKCMASVLSCEDGGFKVILAMANHKSSHVDIQTYCSWTRKWDPSALACSTKFDLMASYSTISDGCMCVKAGIVTTRGVVYWEVTDSDKDRDFVAVYDTSNLDEKKCVRLIPVPDSSDNWMISRFYDVSPDQGSLWCATRERTVSRSHNSPRKGMIKIWSFDDDDNSKKGWTLLHHLDLNPKPLMPHDFEGNSFSYKIYECMRRMDLLMGSPDVQPFSFVSFVPERSDSIYVASEDDIFQYYIGIDELEKTCYGKEDWFEATLFGHGSTYRALTMAELGVWPSLPSSLQANF